MHDSKALLLILMLASTSWPFLDSESIVFSFNIRYLSYFGVNNVKMLSKYCMLSATDVFCMKAAITEQKH